MNWASSAADDGDAVKPHATAPKPRKHARVRTAPVDGTDLHPAPEAPRSSGTENDARLKADKPPHWG